MKKFLLPLVLAVAATINTESCDPETIVLAEQMLDDMNEMLTNGNKYEFNDCTLVIRDNADLISDSEEAKIVSHLTSYCQQSECDILLMTTNEVGLSSMSPGVTYAEIYLPKDSEEWACFTYDVRRDCYSYDCSGERSRAACAGSNGDAILNAGSSHFRHDEYAEGLEAMAELFLKNVTNQKGNKRRLP